MDADDNRDAGAIDAAEATDMPDEIQDDERLEPDERAARGAARAVLVGACDNGDVCTLATAAEQTAAARLVALGLGSIEPPDSSTGSTVPRFTTGRRLNVEMLQEFGEIKVDEDVHKRDYNAAKAKREKLEPRVQEELTHSDLPRVGLRRGITVYLARELWAGIDGDAIGDPPPVEDPDDQPIDPTDHHYDVACDALERVGLGQYVQRRFNVQSLSAYFRRAEEEAEDAYREQHGLSADEPIPLDPQDLLPDELKGVIRLTEKFIAKAVRS